jgi:hypothetical protein
MQVRAAQVRETECNAGVWTQASVRSSRRWHSRILIAKPMQNRITSVCLPYLGDLSRNAIGFGPSIPTSGWHRLSRWKQAKEICPFFLICNFIARMTYGMKVMLGCLPINKYVNARERDTPYQGKGNPSSSKHTHGLSS